jgi:hypothetical protein
LRALALASAIAALAASATAHDPKALAPITRETPIADVIARTRTDYDYPRDDCVDVIDQGLSWHPAMPRSSSDAPSVS